MAASSAADKAAVAAHLATFRRITGDLGPHPEPVMAPVDALTSAPAALVGGEGLEPPTSSV